MVPFIKQLSGLLIPGILFFTACKSSDTLVLTLPPDYAAIQVNHSVQTPTGFILIADTVSVSICPPGTACFAPNSAFVRLRLSKDTTSRTVRLFAWIPNYTRRSVSLGNLTDSITVDLSGQRYKIILRDGRYAAGYMAEGTPKSEAIVQVSRL